MLPMLRTDLCAKIDTTRSFRRNKTIPRLAALCAGLCCFASPHAADAYTITITPGSRALYLQVGAGGYSG